MTAQCVKEGRSRLLAFLLAEEELLQKRIKDLIKAVAEDEKEE